jgi:uncharacterized protein
MEESDGTIKPYRVLSLDGGGMRGIYTAAFLDHLVNQFARTRGVECLDLGKGFDLIVGTSTGAIVGSALAVGRPVADIVNLYRCHGRQIFPHRIRGTFSALWRMLVGGRYVRKGDAVLRAALAKELKDVTMADVLHRRGISLSIPAVAMSSHRAYVFKKTTKSGVRDDHFKLVDVCMASSAAPIFRSLAAIDDRGTCSRPEGELIKPSQVHRSILGWKMGAEAAGLSITAQEFAFDNMARFIGNKFTELGRPIRSVRFPNKDVPAETMKFLALDDARPEAMRRLIQQARNDADLAKSACDDPRNADGQIVKDLMMRLPEMPKAGATMEVTK